MATNPSLIPPYIQTNANNLSYGLGGEVPPEIALEEQALNRKQQIANLLLQRGMQSPQGQMAGRFYVAPSPAQGVAQLASVLAGGYLTNRHDDQRKALADKNRSMTADAIQAYMNKTSAKPVMENMEVDPHLVPPTFDIDKLQPDTYQQRNDNINQAALQMSPGEINAGALADAMDKGDFYTRQPAPQMSNGVPVQTGTQPPSPDAKRQALVEAMTSQIPGLRQFAQMQSQQEMQQAEHEAARAAAEKEHGLAREQDLFKHTENLAAKREGIASNENVRIEQMKQNAILLQMQIDSRERIGQNADDLKRELAANKADMDMTMQKRDEALKRELNASNNETRRDIAAMNADARRQDKQMSPTVQKEIFETDESINAGKAVLTALDQALALNDKAYDGFQAGNRAAVTSNLPFAGKEGANATVDLENIITNQALGQLRTTFGSTPTEGERKILLEVQGSVNLTAPQRKAIWERAKIAVQQRMEFNATKAKQLRDGSYFSGQGPASMPSAPPASPVASAAPTNKQGWKLMQDAKGNKAYVSPDGKQFEEVQ